MTTAELLAVLVPIGNMASAALTGPLLAVRMGARRAEPWQQAGWVVLLAAQGCLLAFGLITQYEGFQWGPIGMCLVAGVNYLLWRQLRRAQRSGDKPTYLRVPDLSPEEAARFVITWQRMAVGPLLLVPASLDEGESDAELDTHNASG